MSGKALADEKRSASEGAPWRGTLALTLFDRHVQVQCDDAIAYALLAANYSALQDQLLTPHLRYIVGRNGATQSFFLVREGTEPLTGLDDAAFLFHFEKDLTVELEKLRSDLYFVHAAVVACAGRAVLFVAPSGSGKSTTTWAVVHHGFDYLSDELAPIDMATLTVQPYPHALCLKEVPPAAYPLPAGTLYTSSTLYIPTAALPGEVAKTPRPLAAIFFLRYCPEAAHPIIRPVGKAEAAARLLANALNPLAHPAAGLDGAIAITQRSACFELCAAALPATCVRIKETVASLISSGP
ncbi:MAG: hypothetical protein NZ578_12035 [Candidatus Binatia bacterium]|nr:hypothetical protein [Candidatus Binatia bacterium]